MAALPPESSTPPIAEAELVERLRAGDEEAFAELLRTHGGRLLATARRLMNSDADAQDAFQDGMLSAFRSIDRFEGQSRLGTWLHRIVVNAALMRLRSASRRREESIEELLPTYTQGGHLREYPQRWDAPADALVQREEVRAAVRAAIAQLPDKYRIPLLLRDIEGLDTRTVAESLEITPNAVKIRLHRARLALRTLIHPHIADAVE